MLTLGKLALLAHDSTNTNLFDKVNKEINLIIYQEDLPEIVLSAFGYDFETMRVFLPAELIRVSGNFIIRTIAGSCID